MIDLNYMKRLDDFKCTNPVCLHVGEIQEKFHRGDAVYCSWCYSVMEKIASFRQKFDLKGEGFYNNKNLQ